jgi:hypothetical protein
MQYLKSYQKKKKNSASSPSIFYLFFYVEINKTKKKQGHASEKGNDI